MSDGLFFGLIIVFFFLVWLVGGGAIRPISFAGPFITPITNVGQSQGAYGPQLRGTLSAAGASVKIGEKSPSASTVSNQTVPTKISNTSVYTGRVVLNHFVSSTPSNDPEQEYLGLGVSNSVGSQGIDVTGWKVLSTVTGASATIPQGAGNLHLGTVALQPIILQPNNTATITTGPSPVNVSYEQNTCSTYLVNPSNYSSCVASHSSDPGFLTGNWRIFLGRQARLWKNSGDTIELIDASGKVVDSFSD